ncbi:Pyridoxal-dependent decarboxylase conserved domain-containing protein [Poseidonocella pacifica]|uniref:Pyridoxal-dependent decarboxylase conserved domain-containing protein n=1 Tax=Poseidonocella pacifica TaxID=871651 RepID=A0A1I0XCE3_9RHOB|nr:pyridoxal-dependent decarboxylase [Poseidonocella pacifica]SFA98357.1 Pyridoxal-dependent decarboxylase conserved domain-containing protein [Poseidonocella pacifica]
MGSHFEALLRGMKAGAGEALREGAKPPSFAPSAWFLGPNGENAAHMQRLLGIALDDHVAARRDYFPTDPDSAADDVETEEARAISCAAMEENLRLLTTALRGSIPVASHRNTSHMYWDITMPSVAGYLATMLFNQNNVAAEGSPVTTQLEIQVGEEMAAMLGYDLKADVRPWGHITCDGSVANLEAAWAARNVKYVAPAMARALREEPSLAPARHVTLRQPNGRWARLLDLDPWTLLNIGVDDAVGLRARVIDTGVAPEDVDAALARWSLRAMGLAGFHAEVLHGVKSPVILVPATAHYSWAKAAGLLGLGQRALLRIPVDLDGRMSLPDLRRTLEQCLTEARPVALVVAVMGSTQESAVDPLVQIAAMRDEFADRGLTFALHADAAWGGYFAALIRGAPPGPPPGERFGFDHAPAETLNPHVRAQFEALPQTDSITLDPHKAGYAPYPAGGLCYRNAEMRWLVAEMAPVVYHGGRVPSIGVFGVEGSKPGAAAAGVWLNHRTIATDVSGYGRLLGRCLFNAKRFAAAVSTLAGPEDLFAVTPFQRLPAEREGGTPAQIAAQRAVVADRIVGYSNAALMEAMAKDPSLKTLFQGIGPDLTVFAYAFNLRRGGALNRDLSLMNALNDAVFHRLSIETSEQRGEVPTQPMIITASSFSPDDYGQPFVDAFAARAGVANPPGASVRFLISTIENPFLSETAEGNFIPTLAEVLRATVLDARKEILAIHGLAD